MHQTTRFVVSVATACLVASVVSAPAAAQRISPTDPEQSADSETVLDAVARRVATLEIQRASLLAVGKRSTDRDVEALAGHEAALLDFIRAQPDARAANAYVTSRVLAALDAKLADVAVSRRLLLVDHTPGDRVSEAAATLERILIDRRSVLRSSGDGIMGARPQS